MDRCSPNALGRRLLSLGAFLMALSFLAGPAVAHGGSVGGGTRDPVEMPLWLFLSTGGGVVSASFLLASFVTDRSFIEWIHERNMRIPTPRRLAPPVRVLLGGLGAVVLVFVVAAAFVGPRRADANFAILVVWVGWWAGFTMFVYLVGNVWPLVNPWRAMADWPTAGKFTYPDNLGAWPSVAGLLFMVWLEVVSPVGENPRLLGMVIVGYTVVTLVGAFTFGPRTWFDRVDPISRVFRYYGQFAPVYWTGRQLAVSWPGNRLVDADLVDGLDEVAFVVAILWVTTYDGLVSTPTWASVTRTVVTVGVPPLLVYFLTIISGFIAFLGAYILAMRATPVFTKTAKSMVFVRNRFALSLIPIAVGYHLAHFFSYFVSLLPSVTRVLFSPLSGLTNPQMYVLPNWFGAVSIAFVLLGHLVAIWSAHAISFDVFPSRLQALKSQYGLVAAMVFYTMMSLWIVTRPSVAPPYL